MKSAIRSDENPDGVLNFEIEDYTECISIDLLRLKMRLSQDETHWKNNLNEAEKQKQ